MKHANIQVRIWLAGIAATLLVAAAGIGFGPASTAPAHEAGSLTSAAPQAEKTSATQAR